MRALPDDINRRRAITSAENGSVRVWNPNAGALLGEYAPPTPSSAALTGHGHSNQKNQGNVSSSSSTGAFPYNP